jgi:hypothetical protein
VHAVGDEQQRQAFGPQALEHGVDACHVGGHQGRGGLVEDEDAWPACQRLGDLHPLPARQRQVAHLRQRVDAFGPGTGQRVLGQAALGPPVDEPEAARRVADGDVVGHGQVRDQR